MTGQNPKMIGIIMDVCVKLIFCQPAADQIMPLLKAWCVSLRSISETMTGKIS